MGRFNLEGICSKEGLETLIERLLRRIECDKGM